MCLILFVSVMIFDGCFKFLWKKVDKYCISWLVCLLLWWIIVLMVLSVLNRKCGFICVCNSLIFDCVSNVFCCLYCLVRICVDKSCVIFFFRVWLIELNSWFFVLYNLMVFMICWFLLCSGIISVELSLYCGCSE